MDPFSITVGVLGIVQSISACLKLSRKFIGPSEHSSAELNSLVDSLYAFNGAMKTFQTHLEIFDDDDEHMSTLEHLKPALTRCNEALATIKDFLKSNGFIGKTLLGARFDKKLKQALKALDEAKALFMFALHADQQSMIASVNKYMHDVGDDVKEIKDLIQNNIQPSQQYRDAKAWFGTHTINNMNSQYHQGNVDGREDGSGQWLLTDETFQAWLTDPENRRTLWLKGSHGVGKTYVCSQAIEHVAHFDDAPIVLHYFYRFDDQPTIDYMVAALVDQLFVQVYRKTRAVAGPLSVFAETNAPTLGTLKTAMGVILHSLLEQNPAPTNDRVRIYLFLDGLDEGPGVLKAAKIVEFFRSFEADLLVDVRLWISCCDTNHLHSLLSACPNIDLDEKAEGDVKAFLKRSVPSFHDEPDHKIEGEDLDDWVLNELQTRAKGNFLFAKLMVDRLQDGVFNMHDLEATIRSSLPDSFAAMYRRTFGQYKKDQRRYASLLFALIVFAKRPLRLRELQEAMTLALSAPQRRSLDPSRTPMQLHKLFPPLIKTHQNPDDPDDPFCRLCHSTVREFLRDNPDVLCDETDMNCQNTITERPFADICLRYLMQDRYGRLLQDPDSADNNAVRPQPLTWRDAQEHHLLTYAAKYWDKHMDTISIEDIVGDDDSGNNGLVPCVLDFLNSPNFQTLIQVQSLSVVGHFWQYTIIGRPSSEVFIKRVLPHWLEMIPEYAHYHRTYRRFVNEWGYLLTCGSCRNDSCPNRFFQGEADRCLCGILGPDTFMSHMTERYPSFMLSKGALDDKSNGTVFASGVSVDGSEATVLSLVPGQADRPVVETWSLRGSNPTLISSMPLSLPEPLFENAYKEMSFLGGIDVLKLTSHVFQRQPNGAYTHLKDLDTLEPTCSLRDVTVQGDVVVVSYRQKGVKPESKEKSSSRDKPKSSDEHDSKASESSSSESESEKEEEKSDSSSSDSAPENSAEETCSEASTIIDSESSSEDGDESGKDDEEEQTKNSEQNADSNSSSNSDSDSGSDSDSSRDEMVLSPEQALNDYHDYAAWRDDDDDDDDDDSTSSSESENEEDDRRPAYPSAKKRKTRSECPHTASVAVYDRRSGTRLFHYEQPIPVLLYHSPPVLHPREPLMVWPLCGGDVLFADYDDKTFFIRRSMPTTRFTRHLCMKVAFSPCGGFLHIASIEAQDVQKQKKNKNKKKGEKSKEKKDGKDEDGTLQKELGLALFVTTHRLSGGKPTRAPPALVHRVKVRLGTVSALSLHQLPFTFSWAPQHLYVAASGCPLNVWRVALFRGDRLPATVPQKTVLLPLSARRRPVQYIPAGSDGRGLVLMGSYQADHRQHVNLVLSGLQHRQSHESRRAFEAYNSPPVGFYVDEERDLGGWVASHTTGSKVLIRNGFRDGKLLRKMELFDTENDCDLEEFAQE